MNHHSMYRQTAFFTRFLIAGLLAIVGVALCSSCAWSADGETVFKESIRPLLKTYCYDCHGPKKQKGDIRLDQLDFDLVQGKSTETWHDALNKINLGEMPPEDAPQLPGPDRRKLVGWLTEQLRLAARARQGTGGQVVMRRLNRAEYQLSLIHI